MSPRKKAKAQKNSAQKNSIADFFEAADLPPISDAKVVFTSHGINTRSSKSSDPALSGLSDNISLSGQSGHESFPKSAIRPSLLPETILPGPSSMRLLGVIRPSADLTEVADPESTWKPMGPFRILDRGLELSTDYSRVLKIVDRELWQLEHYVTKAINSIDPHVFYLNKRIKGLLNSVTPAARLHDQIQALSAQVEALRSQLETVVLGAAAASAACTSPFPSASADLSSLSAPSGADSRLEELQGRIVVASELLGSQMAWNAEFEGRVRELELDLEGRVRVLERSVSVPSPAPLPSVPASAPRPGPPIGVAAGPVRGSTKGSASAPRPVPVVASLSATAATSAAADFGPSAPPVAGPAPAPAPAPAAPRPAKEAGCG